MTPEERQAVCEEHGEDCIIYDGKHIRKSWMVEVGKMLREAWDNVFYGSPQCHGGQTGKFCSECGEKL